MPLAVLTIAIAALAADAYNPPRQTPTQMAKMQAWSREAEKLSAAATPALLAKLGSADFRRALGECCPVAAAMSPHQLLAALRAELRAAELVHNFPTDTAANDTMVEDTSLAAEAGGNLSYFANIWEYVPSACFYHCRRVLRHSVLPCDSVDGSVGVHRNGSEKGVRGGSCLPWVGPDAALTNLLEATILCKRCE